MKTFAKWLTGIILLFLCVYFYRKLIPIYRVEIRSELIMLGDLNGDHQWGADDLLAMESFLQDPFAYPDSFAQQLDLNQNGRLDPEDLTILRTLAAHPDPYAAEQVAKEQGIAFPRPRELYRYQTIGAYRPRPLWALPAPHAVPTLAWLDALSASPGNGGYSDALEADLYNEAVRLKEAFRKRESRLLPQELAYAQQKLAACQIHHKQNARFEMLLDLIAMVEDAETLQATPAQEKPQRLLRFRNHLQELLLSSEFKAFQGGQVTWQDILHIIERNLKEDLGLEYRFEALGPPRNLTHLENYLDRAEWQYYKTATRIEDFQRLLAFAQHDPRYLRAVARTSRKHQDPGVENHNLPMLLLFREALAIKGGDKKRAVGLLDEAIRVPFAWIKSIPPEKLPRSLAFDNFLLPGNKEDGNDKSRHWNVFGGICLYKSSDEALDLALKRELKDLKEAGYTPEGMTEFIRDMIANLNGMYYVMVIEPNLISVKKNGQING